VFDERDAFIDIKMTKLIEKNGWTMFPAKCTPVSLRPPVAPSIVLPSGKIAHGTWVKAGSEPPGPTRQTWVDSLNKTWGGRLLRKPNAGKHFDKFSLRLLEIFKITYLVEKKEVVFNVISQMSWNLGNLERALNYLEESKTILRNLIKRAPRQMAAREEIFKRVESIQKYRLLYSMLTKDGDPSGLLWTRVPCTDEIPLTSKDRRWRLFFRLNRILAAWPPSMVRDGREGQGNSGFDDEEKMKAVLESKRHFKAWSEISRFTDKEFFNKDHNSEIAKKYGGVTPEWLEKVSTNWVRPVWKICDEIAGNRFLGGPISGSTVKEWRLASRRRRR